MATITSFGKTPVFQIKSEISHYGEYSGWTPEGKPYNVDTTNWKICSLFLQTKEGVDSSPFFDKETLSEIELTCRLTSVFSIPKTKQTLLFTVSLLGWKVYFEYKVPEEIPFLTQKAHSCDLLAMKKVVLEIFYFLLLQALNIRKDNAIPLGKKMASFTYERLLCVTPSYIASSKVKEMESFLKQLKSPTLISPFARKEPIVQLIPLSAPPFKRVKRSKS